MANDGNLTRLVIMMIAVFAIMSFLKPDLFPTFDSLVSMAFQFPEFGILAIAMMITMLTGGIDLSIVGIANLSAIMSGVAMVKVIPNVIGSGSELITILLAVVIALIVGTLCGLLNGVAISVFGIPPILTTLGSMQLFMGLGIVITQGKAIYGFPMLFTELGAGSLLYIPIPLIIFILFIVFFSILLKKTSYGMKLYMMGTNPVASKYSGVNNLKITIQTYMYSGALAACAGLLIASRTNSANADYGSSYTLQALLVAVLGGVNPNGGFGRIAGVVVAILTLQFLSTGFNMLHITNFFKDFIWGAVLIIVMVTNYISSQRKEKRG
ncbi:ABC transporter permease [Niallia nealsonii]|uniref:ABC transporter permease n=2 Tax=Niallia nealsonii TaxID=115979 RepID=A0A2N0Z793_9BACI|nr:ABC transporter permease [Niallia nealsonii]